MTLCDDLQKIREAIQELVGPALDTVEREFGPGMLYMVQQMIAGRIRVAQDKDLASSDFYNEHPANPFDQP